MFITLFLYYFSPNPILRGTNYSSIKDFPIESSEGFSVIGYGLF